MATPRLRVILISGIANNKYSIDFTVLMEYKYKPHNKEIKIDKYHKFKVIGTVVTLAIILLFMTQKIMLVKTLITIAAFVGLNKVVTSYKRVIYIPIEIEVLSFGIILCSVSFGVAAGLATALIGGLVYVFYSNSLSPFSIPMLIGYFVG